MRSMNIRTPRKKFAHAWYAYSTVCVFENQIRPCLDFTTTLLFQSFAKLANRQSVHKSQQQLTNLLPPETKLPETLKIIDDAQQSRGHNGKYEAIFLDLKG